MGCHEEVYAGVTGCDSCFRRPVLHAFLEADWRAGRVRSERGDQCEGWCNIVGDRGWWFGAEGKNGGGEECSDSGHISEVEPRGCGTEEKERGRERLLGFQSEQRDDGRANSAMGEKQVYRQRTGILSGSVKSEMRQDIHAEVLSSRKQMTLGSRERFWMET